MIKMRKRFNPRGLCYLILKMMKDEPAYGYGILERLRELSGGFLEPSYGTIYGALERFEDKGYIRRVEESHEDRKYFKITEKGRRRLEELEKVREEIRKKVRRGLLGIMNIYRNVHGEEEFEKLLEMIEKEFRSG